MASSNQLKPYKLVHAIDLRFADVVDTIDENLEIELENSGEDDEGALRLDLRATRWNGLEITVEARLNEAKLKEVLAGGLDAAAETRMIVSVRCPTTKMRRVVPLVSDAERPDTWATDIRIERRDVRSRVEFHPLLYRLTEIPDLNGTPGGEARHRFALLAMGQPTTLAIDEVDRSPGGPITIKWRDFADGKNLWLEKYKQTMYYFEYDEAKPVLYLNSRHKNLRALLFERTDDTVDSGLRRLMSGWLAEVVWTQLFQAAVASLASESDGDPIVLPDGWRGDVLKKFAVHMYIDLPISAALEAIIEAKTSPDQFGALMSKASTIVQHITGSEKLFSTAVRAAEKGSSSSTEGSST